MAIGFGAAQGTMPGTDTGSATWDLTDSNLATGDGVGMMLVVVGSDAAAGTADTARGLLGIGFWDGSNKAGYSSAIEAGGLDTSRSGTTFDIITVREENSAGDYIKIDESSTLDKGFRLQETNNDYSDAFNTLAFIVNGSDSNCQAGLISGSGTDQDITLTGNNKPDFILFTNSWQSGVGGGTDAGLSFGCAVRASDDSYTNMCIAMSSNDGSAASNCYFAGDTEDYCAVELKDGDTSLDAAYRVTDFTNGFTLTQAAGSGTTGVAYLAVWLDADYEAKLFEHTNPASDGVQDVTDPGFEPTCIIEGRLNATSAGSVLSSGAPAEGFALWIVTGKQRGRQLP